jgi:hypothetical protein
VITLRPERRRALQLLTRSPNGRSDAIMLAYGFTLDMLGGLVFDGLATMQPASVTPRSGGRQKIIVWVQITDRGREAIGG